MRRVAKPWVVAGGLALLAGGGLAVAAASVAVPDPWRQDAQPTTVYFADGVTQLGAFHHMDAEFVPLDEMSPAVRDAVVDSTDPVFHERTVGLVEVVKAAADILRGHEFSVGDPVAERYLAQFDDDDAAGPAAPSSFRQLATISKLVRTQPRDQILEDYLNTAYFGRGVYGIEKAARAYFSKGAGELSESEAALLAGILPAPDNWDPAISPEIAQERWAVVLRAMVSAGSLTEGEAASADYPTTQPYARADGFSGDRGYLMDMVRTELTGLGITDLESAGLTVVSTFDLSMQQAAAGAVASLPADKSPNTRVTLVSIDPTSGALRALYTGQDYRVTTRNGAVLDRAHGGSTFKTFALIAALENGLTLDHQFPSTTPIDVDGYVVTNVDGRDRGLISLMDATAQSVNTVYAQVNALVGPERTRDVALRAGLPEDTVGLIVDPANVFGTASPRPVDMATVFATYAAGGTRHDRFVVAAVRDRVGALIHEGGNTGEQVFDSRVIASATEAMTGVVDYGTGSAAKLPDRPAAGKTGTSDGNLSAWFCGFVPQLATVVAMYEVSEDGSEQSITPFGGVSPVMGGSYPAIVWQRFMTAATRGMEVVALLATGQGTP